MNEAFPSQRKKMLRYGASFFMYIFIMYAFWPNPDLPDDDGVDEAYARTAVYLLLERLALVEKFRAQDARLYAYVQVVLFEPQFGGDLRGAVADDLAPCIRQLAFGDFRGDIGAFEKLLQLVAHQHGFGPSHGCSSVDSDRRDCSFSAFAAAFSVAFSELSAAFRSCVTAPSATEQSG